MSQTKVFCRIALRITFQICKVHNSAILFFEVSSTYPGDNKKVLTLNATGASGYELRTSEVANTEAQVWKIENSYSEQFKISNKRFPSVTLSVADISEGKKAGITTNANASPFGWKLSEVCDIKQEAFKPNLIPGSIEAEDFDKGCPEETYSNRDEANADGEYRPEQAWILKKIIRKLLRWPDKQGRMAGL